MSRRLPQNRHRARQWCHHHLTRPGARRQRILLRQHRMLRQEARLILVSELAQISRERRRVFERFISHIQVSRRADWEFLDY